MRVLLKSQHAVVVKTGSDFQHGYLALEILETDTTASVKLPYMDVQSFPIDQVFVFVNSKFISIDNVPSRMRYASQYDGRKRDENAILLSDAAKCGINLKKANLLALDDFQRGATKVFQSIPNTMHSWVQHGGAPQHVWVCNPDPTVSNAVSLAHGHGYAGYLNSFIRDIIGRDNCPHFGVMYLDFCGFFETHQQDIETVFRNHARLFADTVLIHITTSRREGVDAVYITKWIKYWCGIFNCGKIKVVKSPHSSTMVKVAVVVARNKENPRTIYDGRRVGSYFGDIYFKGTVTNVWRDINKCRYAHIVYEDGDEEDVDLDEIKDMMI